MSFTKENFIAELKKLEPAVEVSRETMDKLELYEAELKKWQKKINLVSNSTINNAWERHFLDSAQLYPLMKDISGVKMDIGSGAGFPALVLSIMGIENYHVVESDIRKTIFLKEIIRKCSLDVTVHARRIDMVELKDVKAITARALADLTKLFEYSEQFLEDDTVCIFQKGQKGEEEIEQAKAVWVFDIKKHSSILDDNSYIYQISNIKR